MKIKIIGAGLAGVEAAFYLANKGVSVSLYEMRPKKMTEIHKTDLFAELVCSNSLRSNDSHNAVGMLKREMEFFNSIVLSAAKLTEVPAGSSLAVDRTLFSKHITDIISNHKNITIYKEEVLEIDEGIPVIIAAGPLVSEGLFSNISKLLNNEGLHFFDAVAPIISFDSIDMNKAYFKSRYDKGGKDYINCPMTKDEYNTFYNELINSSVVDVKEFEENIFEGCMPVEVMAKRGYETLTYGPLKPVGLEKEIGDRPYAVVQLRQDDALKTMYNIVGFQTHLTFGAQRKVISLIPGLENANILRYGVMHRNTYIESPKFLNFGYQVKDKPNIFFAGQISGVEGYVESAASGIVCAINVYEYLKNNKLVELPVDTMIGAMARYISTPNKSFVPMNANLGLLNSLDFKHSKKDRKRLYFERSMEQLNRLENLK